MRWLLRVALISCACAHPTPGSYASLKVADGHRFGGPRELTLYGDNDRRDNERQLDELQAQLERHGFRVARSLDAVAFRTRYLLQVKGQCWDAMGVGDLSIEAIDGPTGETAFRARLKNNDWCPRVFFDDVAAALDAVWPDHQRPADHAAATF